MTTFATDRLDTLVIARLETSARPPSPAELAKALRRFSPRNLTDAQWRDAITAALDGLGAREIVDAKRKTRPDELARRIGRHGARTWKQLADRVLPALALGVEAADGKAHERLSGRDEWAAAIVARALGLWRAGLPPSPSAMCDALVWRELGLAGTPKRCPPEVRAHFVRRHAGGDAGPPERLVRALAAQTVDAPRVELQALRDGLVRLWLTGREVGARPEAAPLAQAASAAPVAPEAVAPAAHEAAAHEAPTTLAAPEATELPQSAAASAPLAHAPPAAPEPPEPSAAPERPAAPEPPAASAVPEPAAAPAPPAPPARPLIAEVRAVADAARDGVFGERKVFISSVWEALRAMPAWTSLGLDELKARLVAAHRGGELVLARADLVAAMDPALVAASETRTDGATFHFVVREPHP